MRALVAVVLFALLAAPTPARAEWEVRRSGLDARVVARYKVALRRDPDDAQSLTRLVALYRQHRSVAALISEYGAEVARAPRFEDVLVLGHLEEHRGDLDAAARHYRRALQLRPDDARALVPLAETLLRQQKPDEARPLFDTALANPEPRRRRLVLRRLADLTARDPARAGERRRYLEQLAALEPADEALRRELADALAAAGEPARAAAEYARLAERLRGRDPLRFAETLVRQGELLETAKNDDEALQLYERAAASAPRGHHLRRSAAEHTAGVYRRRDQLRELREKWEARWPAGARDAQEWELLARLADELGDAKGARAAYKKAVAGAGASIEARRRLITLLTREGNEDEALVELRRLVAAAPGDGRYRLELAERLWQSSGGAPERVKEARSIAEHAGKQAKDPSVHAALAELYTRWGLPDLALKERELLVRVEPQEEAHLIDLGELYFQRGQKARAVDTWRKLLTLGRKPEQAMARLADVYAEHELYVESLDLYRRAQALAPHDLLLKKGLAVTLERMHRDDEARDAWEAIFDEALTTGQRQLVAEVRTRLLALLVRATRVVARLPSYRNRAEGSRDELVATGYGLLTAECFARLDRLSDAERLLRSLSAKVKAPDLRADLLVGLAGVLRQRQKLADAVAALRQAAELQPSRQKEIYSQIADLSLRLYDDADALRYAERALALAPTDPQAQVRVGEILEKKEDVAGAIAAYRRALDSNDRLWRVRFALARLHLRRGEAREAAQLYHDVVRRATEEEIVGDAARRALALDEYLGTLGELERDLAPLALRAGDHHVHGKLLVELYDRYAGPLAMRAESGDAAAASELARLATHASGPLLEALIDGDVAQQRRAVRLLGLIGDASAALPLARLAGGKGRRGSGPEPDIELRADAALAAARVADASAADAFVELLQSPERPLRVAAAYGLGRLRDAKGRAALSRALTDSAPAVRGLACLGLARQHENAAIRDLVRLARGGPDASRASCAFALAVLRPRDEASHDALVDALEHGPEPVARAAALALAGRATAPLVRALVAHAAPSVRAAARVALHAPVEIVWREPSWALRELEPLAWIRALPLVAGPAPSWSNVAAPLGTAVEAALRRDDDGGAGDTARVTNHDGGAGDTAHVTNHDGGAGDTAHVTNHDGGAGDTARVLADLVSDGAFGFAPLADVTLDDAERASFAAALRPALVRRLTDPASAAAAALALAAADPAALLAEVPSLPLAVQTLALESIARRPPFALPSSTDRALAGLLRDRSSWRVRRGAALVLGVATRPHLPDELRRALQEARSDEHGLVREAAARALR